MEFRNSYKWPGMQAYLESASFSEFIRHPKFGPAFMGSRRQADSLCDTDGRLMMDVVGRYETLQQDFAAIAARIGLPAAALGWRNASRNRDAADPTAADRAHLAEMYRRDYELFYPAAAPATAAAAGAQA